MYIVASVMSGAVGLDPLADHLPPQDRRLEHVGLVDQRDVPTAGPGGRDGDVGDPLDLGAAVDHGVDRLDVAALRSRGSTWRRSRGRR
jgi:hypothetical protein